MKNKTVPSLFWGVAFGFGCLLAAWTAFFVVAARHRVPDVPLATAGKPVKEPDGAGPR
jgi:hypothetical protein